MYFTKRRFSVFVVAFALAANMFVDASDKKGFRRLNPAKEKKVKKTRKARKATKKGPKNDPSSSPSAEPSHSPSTGPTPYPSAAPSLETPARSSSPSRSPSAGPTPYPSAAPSLETPAPSSSPSSSPSAEPSSSPSASAAPSSSPSASAAPSSSPSCIRESLTVELTLDDYPDETIFGLKDSSDEVIAEEKDFPEPNVFETSTYTYELCSGEAYTASLGDTSGDGQTFDIRCFCEVVVAKAYNQDGDTLFEVRNGDFLYGNSRDFPFTLPGSGDSDISFSLDIFTDFRPEETGWIILDSSNIEIARKTVTYEDSYKLYTKTISAPPGDYTFVLTDSGGDGMWNFRSRNDDGTCDFGLPKTACPIPGVVGKVGEVILFETVWDGDFDDVWDGSSLEFTFTMP